MAYSPEQKENLIKTILASIEEGNSTRKAVKAAGISSKTFWGWLAADEDLVKQYARACDDRNEAKFDSIADDYNAKPKLDDYGKVDTGWVALQRLKIDAKKWELSKLNPKKYGDKVDVTTGGDKLPAAPTQIVLEVVKPNEE